MTVVADVLAVFRGDTSDLEGASSRAATAVSGIHDAAAGGSGGSSGPALSSHFDAATSSVGDLAKRAGEGEAALDELGHKAEGVGNSLKQMVVPVLGAAGLGGLLDMAKNTTIEMQTLGVQFNAAFGGSGQSALHTAIGDANQFGVSIAAAGAAYQGLGLVTKGTSSELQSDFKAAADGAAGLGMSVDSVSGMLTNYYQLVQRVGGTGGTANRAATALLTSNLIDPTTANNLRLQANQGANAQSLLDTINTDIESRFGGAGKAQANTLGGQIQTFKNQFSEGTSGAFSSVTSGMQSGLKDLNKDMDSQGFKQATQDITGFIGAMAHGVEIIGPFAKTLAEVALDITAMLSHIPMLGEAVGVLVAAFLAWQAINIIQTITGAVRGLATLATAQGTVTSTTATSTAAIEAQTLALQANAGAAGASGAAAVERAGLSGIGSVGIGGVVPAASSASSVASDAEQTSMFGKLGTWMTSGMGLSVMGLVGSQIAGHVIGGQTGSAISTIGGMAGGGAMLGSMMGPEGTLAGAGIGAAAGLIVNAFQDSAQAQAANTAAVNNMANTWERDHPVASEGGLPTAAGINTHYQQAAGSLKEAYDKYIKENSAPGGKVQGQETGTFVNIPKDPTLQQMSQFITNPNTATDTNGETAATQEFQKASAQHRNEISNLSDIAKKGGMTVGGAESFATKNNIDISQPLAANVEAINNFTAALHTAQGSAEQISSSYNFIANQVGGQYGEQTANPNALIATAGKPEGLNAAQSQAQFFNLAGPNNANLDLSAQGMNINPQTLASGTTATPAGSTALGGASSVTNITPQEAQLLNATLSTTLQYTQALQGEQQAAFAVSQAEFGLSQAYFALSQAVFSAEQATFSLGRAQIANTVAQVTQASATVATSTAITSGYLPANANVAAALAQVTSLTAAQITAINSEVSSYNTLEAAMYGVQGSGMSLFTTYTTLTGAVQTLQAQTQQYQNLLNEPLQGTEQYSAAQEQYKVQEAAVQQQIDTLELQRVPTNDPRIQTLQAQLALLQAQADLSTQINTQGVGQQQFQIQQAQLGPQQSAATQLGAAQSMGALNTQLLAAQQALAPVNASYVALNSQLTVAQQKNSAVTGALQQQASADQGAITANNSLTVAANGVTSANNSLVAAHNAVHTAAFNVTTSQWSYQGSLVAVQTATNTLAGEFLGNFATALTDTQGYITNIGANFTSVTQGMSQAVSFLGQSSAASLSGNSLLASEYQTLIGLTGKGLVSAQQVAAVIAPGLSSMAGGGIGAAALGAADGGGPLLASGGTVTAGGTATLHAGEVVMTPGQVLQLVQQYGGGQAQQWVAAALHNGIESGAGASINELAGGIGPAAGIFQFEPGTWLGNGGGAFAGTQANGMSGASVANAAQQVQVFINASGGRGGESFGAWGPDFGVGYGGHTWPPAHGSKVANMIDSMFSQHFSNGGFVPGSGGVPIMAHGGEFVVSNAMLSQLNGSGVAGGGRGGGLTLQMPQGAVQVKIEVSGEGASSISSTLATELQNAVEDAFNQIMMKWNGA